MVFSLLTCKCFSTHPAPNTSPLNFEGNATSSRSISLMWEPPLFEDQNGVITSYIINVVLNETAENFQLSTAEPRLFLDSLRPFGTYSFVIAAQTIAGVGPFSTVLTIATPEDSELCLWWVMYYNRFLEDHYKNVFGRESSLRSSHDSFGLWSDARHSYQLSYCGSGIGAEDISCIYIFQDIIMQLLSNARTPVAQFVGAFGQYSEDPCSSFC